MDESWLHRYPEFERDHFWWRVRRDLVGGIVDRHSSGRRLRILDIGCGTGQTLKLLSKSHEVVGVEPDPNAVALSDVASHIRAGPVESMTFDPESFDVILMLDVLEHLDEPVTTLSSFREWVTRDGLLVILVPAHGWLWTSHDDANHHRSRYTRRGLLAELEEGGWHSSSSRYLFAPLVAPKIAQVLLERSGVNRAAGQPSMPPRFVNEAAYRILGVENSLGLLRRFIGTSVLALASPEERSSS